MGGPHDREDRSTEGGEGGGFKRGGHNKSLQLSA